MSKKQQETPSKSRHPRERRHTITGLDVALLAHCSSSRDKRLFLRYLIEHLEDSYSLYREERRANEEKQSEERHQEALAQLQDALELYKLLGDMVFKAKQAIEEEARAKGREAKQYATTLLFSICKRFESGYFIASFWIGDGAICLLEDEKATLMGQPDSGEYAGQTRFLTNHSIFSSFEDVMRRITYKYVNDFKALILMTDGVSDPKLETDALLQSTEAWNDLWQELQQGLKLQADISAREASMHLLQWLDFWSTGNHDDRTIAILY